MPQEQLSLSKASLAYAKLASTPTQTAWSQVYNAGNLFACLSLTVTESEEEHASLATTGKELLNNLEAEFFTLEEKTITNIKQALEKSIKQVPQEIHTNFCLAFFKENTLYLFLLGRGRVVMKRQNKLGLLITNNDEEEKDLQTASGYLQNGDTIILETNQFAKNVSDKHLADALQLELPNDIAEALSLNMHEQTDGGQAAIIITYHGISKPMSLSSHEPVIEEELVTQASEPVPSHHEKTSPSFHFPNLKKFLPAFSLPFGQHKRHINMRLNHRKKFFLSITLVILLILLVSIILTKQKQQTDKLNTLFQATYSPAFKNYDEGQSLKGLNDSESHDDFVKAEKLLKDNQDKFPQGSSQRKQVDDLLAKVESAIGDTTAPTNQTSVKEASVDDTDLLSIEKTTPDGTGFSQDDNNIYYLTTKTVSSISKSDGKKKDLITNDNDWKQAVSVVPYQANLYVLDPKTGILKYTGGSSGFGKSNYLKSTVDLSKAVNMAIDSSVWVLSSDGTIQKFTRGQTDSFSISGLTKPFSHPTKMYTDKDINNIYILDNGNSRVVELSNNGSFEKEYTASVIQKATDFEVLEKDKKILILSGGKIWELDL